MIVDVAPHYSVIKLEDGMSVLRSMFPDGQADEMNVVLFSTSGVHGTYTTIEEIEESPLDEDGNPQQLTVLIFHPRLVCMRYGTIEPKPEDIPFLKTLRASSHAALCRIGMSD